MSKISQNKANIGQTESNCQNSEENTNSDFKLEVLSPLDKKDDPRILKYLKHIKDAVENKDVKNLALTGVYGSGKSTIIKSFKSLHPDTKVLHISLASFKEIKDSDYKDFKDQIQLNILQQIIYSQKADKLPESRINRIREINIRERKNWSKVLVFLLFLVSTYSLLKFYTFQINPNNWSTSLSFNWGAFLYTIVFIFSSIFIGLHLLKVFFNSKINKVNIKGEVGVADGVEHKDFLNKNIDEILYFFEKNPTNVVVIEDLDRFNTTEIYRTLREINFILNTYLKNIYSDDSKKVTFLYAIKDDLFLNELDRTKFFDLIIPTIPFVNFSNAKNVLNTKLDSIFCDKDVFAKPSKDFINTVSAFITDNRTLLNILNEFTVYKEQQRLENEELNSEKLLALIIYKNLRPKDFSKLHTGKSNIDIAFSNKEILVKSLIQEEKDKIEEKNKELKIVREESLKSIKELNTIFLYHIKEKIGSNRIKELVYDSKQKTLQEIIDKSLNLNQFYNNNIQYYNSLNQINNTSFSLKEIDNILGYTYSERYDLIVNKNNLIIEKEKEIIELRDNLNKIHNWSLKEILKHKDFSKSLLKDNFGKFYSESVIDSEKVYNDSLAMFLFEKGYIDEHYREYISVFQQGGLNEKDQEFKINIISRINEPKPFNYELSNIGDIIDELPINYFQDDRILNIGLVDFITTHREVYPEQFRAILSLISQWNKRTRQFLREYITEGNHRELFITELGKSWKELWTAIQKTESDFIENDKKYILYLLLDNSDGNTFKSLNQNKLLSNYISDSIDILFDFETEQKLEKIKRILSNDALDVKFNDLSQLTDRYSKLFEFVYDNNMYKINIDNLGTILENKLDDFDKSKFDNSNLTYIFESGLEKLINYISKDNFESYLTNVYSKLENNQDEKEEYILKVIDIEKLNIEKRLEFLEKQENRISDIYELADIEFYDLIFKHNRIKVDWDNVYKYYFENDKTFNDILINFLNIDENYTDLSTSNIKLGVDDENQEEFISKLIENKKLTTNALESLIKSFPANYKIIEFDFSNIEKNKVELLIDKKIIELNSENFEDIKKNHSDLHIKLLLRDWANYLDYANKYDIEITDKIKILQYDNLTDSLKRSIIKNQITTDDLKNKKLAEEVSLLIINGISDTKINVTELLDINKLKSLLSHNLGDEEKIRLLNIYKNLLSKKNILDLKEFLPKPYNKDISPKGQLIADNDNHNSEFIKTLQSVGIAGNIKEQKDKIRVWLKKYN